MSLSIIFISPYKLLNMFRATLCSSSGADDLVVFFHVWCSAVTANTAMALHHTWKNTTKSSAPEDGDKVAWNMLSNL